MSDQNSLDYLKKLVEEQQVRILSLEKKVSAAQTQAEAAENYTRQDCLIFRGKLNIRSGYSLRDEMMRLIDFHTGVQFPNWCMNTAHWLKYGKSVIIRFNNKAVRESIYRNRVPQDDAKRGLFIHESLTDSKMKLVGRCSQLRKDGRISTYFTQGGNVHVKKSKHGPSLKVTPDMTNDAILDELAKMPETYRHAVTRPAVSEGAVPSTQQADGNQVGSEPAQTNQEGSEPAHATQAGSEPGQPTERHSEAAHTTQTSSEPAQITNTQRTVVGTDAPQHQISETAVKQYTDTTDEPIGAVGGEVDSSSATTSTEQVNVDSEPPKLQQNIASEHQSKGPADKAQQKKDSKGKTKNDQRQTAVVAINDESDSGSDCSQRHVDQEVSLHTVSQPSPPSDSKNRKPRRKNRK